ncbi:MAG: aminotransferase class I/II-fold pyridoxal phosphate-dependent enzyme [Candidatus Magnetomorum sp.]|nr:aminotransferase class I/II-fold pyridoxal phosphate-dependent enzyme [Candidatus Magnetomorum sp.]
METDIFEKCKTSGGNLGLLRLLKDQYFVQPILSGIPGPKMTFNGKQVIVWDISNYLGLSNHESIKKSAIESLNTSGLSSPMGSRIFTGTTSKHIHLENKLATFLMKEKSVIFQSGLMGLLGSIDALVDQEDTLLIDHLSHVSMLDGNLFAASGKNIKYYQHNDMESLESQLKIISKQSSGGVLIVTEGLFGMHGDLAKLQDICLLKDRYHARLFVDDSHGCGIMGHSGKGVGEFLGVQDNIDMYYTSFSHSFAATGGIVAGAEPVIDWIRFNAKPNIYAETLPCIYVDAIDNALDVITTQTECRHSLWAIAKKLQEGLVALGYDIGETQSPITPVYVPSENIKQTMDMVIMMREKQGVFVSAMLQPVVPYGMVLFRMIPTAAHSFEDVEITLNAYQALRDQFNLKLPGKKMTLFLKNFSSYDRIMNNRQSLWSKN